MIQIGAKDDKDKDAMALTRCFFKPPMRKMATEVRSANIP